MYVYMNTYIYTYVHIHTCFHCHTGLNCVDVQSPCPKWPTQLRSQEVNVAAVDDSKAEIDPVGCWSSVHVQYPDLPKALN